MKKAPHGLHTVHGWVLEAERIAVLSGAGMSAESGVPTFRDAQDGYWAQFNPQDMASERGFRAAPQRVWDWYAHRRAGVAQVQPNAGHVALARFARAHPGRLTVITQNVDGLHQRAGSSGVLCLHGDLLADRWLEAPRACCRLEDAEPGSPPRCGSCGNLVRPGVVWFGENLPVDVFEAARQAAQGADLMLVVGTAGAVYPAAGLARLARQAGARVVVVNPVASELDDVAHGVLRGTAAQLLPQLLEPGAGRPDQETP
ncbi:NAD-dependent protein deacylase [Melaminivora sp.]|uniref:SIR2 family NAD-dependent protein deacylase n=1 Tax=Melaminivora sp. TaxID=1933032 RepID=UPI0028B02A88|nr:NAD-dependent protein deacylase [Melaminivora sp.]